MSPRPARATTRRKIVLIAPNWLGDAVMSLPAVGLLANAPGVTLGVCAPPYTARVFDGVDGVDELWVDPDRTRRARITRRARALRAWAADAAVILPPSFSSALGPLLARVPVRVGYASDGRRALLSRSRATPPRTVHLAASYEALAAMALESVEREAPSAFSTRGPRVLALESERVAARLRAAGVTDRFVLVVPGAAFGPAKSWPWERYRALCAGVAAEVPVVLAGASADRERCARIAEGIAGVVDLTGTTSLGELFALAARASVMVANDSGSPHVAAALGTPTVVLFGSTSPAWTAPRGPHVRILQHEVHCNPCFRRTCPTQLECFNGIAVDTVLRETRAAMDAVAAS